jgi:small-conductance mechanosensitive channel
MLMHTLVHWLEQNLGISPALQTKVLESLVVILALSVLHLVLGRVIVPRVHDIYIRYRIRKTAGYVLVLIGLFVVGRVWIRGFQAMVTYLGILSAGVAIALRDPLVNLAAWIFIVWRRPFEVGDRIQVGSNAGDVIDIRIFQFTLMEIGNWVGADQSTGRIIHMPNGKVFSEPLANYSKGFQYIWNEIAVLVTFESNWRKAKELLARIGSKHAEELSTSAEERVRQAARKFMIFYTKLTPTVYTSVKDSGILLTIRYLCEPRRRRGTEEAIWEDILTEFARHGDIDFAYSTTRYYDNLREGKQAARPVEGAGLAPPPSTETPNGDIGDRTSPG